MIAQWQGLRFPPKSEPRPQKLDTDTRWGEWVDARIQAHLAEHVSGYNKAVGEAIGDQVGGLEKDLCSENKTLRRELAELRSQIKKLEREKVAPTIIGWKLDGVKFRAIPFYSDGKPGVPIPLRPLFEEYNEQVCR